MTPSDLGQDMVMFGKPAAAMAIRAVCSGL